MDPLGFGHWNPVSAKPDRRRILPEQSTTGFIFLREAYCSGLRMKYDMTSLLHFFCSMEDLLHFLGASEYPTELSWLATFSCGEHSYSSTFPGKPWVVIQNACHTKSALKMCKLCVCNLAKSSLMEIPNTPHCIVGRLCSIRSGL